MPTITLGAAEYEIHPPRRRIEIVEVRNAVLADAKERAYHTCLGRAARGLWLARGPASDETAERPLLHREPRYSGDPVAYGAEVYEALVARYPEAEIDAAATRAFLLWFAPERLAEMPSQEHIAEAEDFTAPPVATPSTNGGG